MKAVGYIRVSTDEQASHGVSLEAQRAKVEAYAQLYDLELVEVVADAGLSAKSMDRPGLQQVLAMLRVARCRRWWWRSWIGSPDRCATWVL